MKNFSSRESRSPRVMLIIILLLLGVTLIASAGFRVVRYALTRFGDSFFYPYMRITAPADKLSDTSLLLEDKGSLAAKVEKLTHANAELAMQSQAVHSLMDENQKLRSLLGLRYRPGQKYIIGEILLRDPLHFRSGFTINKGFRDGVVSGAAVIDVTPEGKLLLAGIITQVSMRTSKVTTLLDPSLRISATVASNGQSGFINSGDRSVSRNRIGIAMLPPRDDYIHGSLVNTSGFEHGIPGGIKIGELYTQDVSRSYEQEDFQCEIVPAVKFESLRFVAVAIIPHEPQVP